MRLWHRFFIPRAGGVLSKDGALAALAAAGFDACERDAATNGGPGILFFEEADEEVYHFLRESSCGGRERVLAVAARREALAGGAAWGLLRAGASDVLVWSETPDPAAAAAARFGRWESVDRIVESALVRENLVGQSAVWKSLLRRVVEVGRFTDTPVLILGESGTGKELLARLIHTLDARASKGDLVVLDCTTVVPELSGSEFFGHERGSYTGATNSRDGVFALADGGTLFLDEVGELRPRLQAELLRVLQERTYKRVGSNEWRRTSFRLICATNRNLQREQEDGQFRLDFFQRIAGWTCVVPPLRERADDVLQLAEHFMRQLCPGAEPPPLDEAVREYLLRRDYAGNVRELRALVEHTVKRHAGPGPITVGDVAEEQRPLSGGSPWDWRDAQFEQSIRRAISFGVGLKEIGNAASETAIRIAVSDEEGNLQRAARRLGVTDRALQMRRATRKEGQKPADLIAEGVVVEAAAGDA
jgi:transcriptional regulator with GAF, ATPase, and Fis domain